MPTKTTSAGSTLFAVTKKLPSVEAVVSFVSVFGFLKPQKKPNALA